jgi:hypothetical protein
MSKATQARDLAHRYLSGRRGLVVISAVMLAGAAAFNWSWLVALGVAPLLLSLAPCVAMCALGFCMSRMGGKSCSAAAPHQSAHHAAVHEQHSQEGEQRQPADHR